MCVPVYRFSSIEKEMKIIREGPTGRRAPGRGDSSCYKLFKTSTDLKKKPSISETLDLANALHILGAEMLEAGTSKEPLICCSKIKKTSTYFRRVDLRACSKISEKDRGRGQTIAELF